LAGGDLYFKASRVAPSRPNRKATAARRRPGSERRRGRSAR